MPEIGKINDLINVEACQNQINQTVGALHKIVDELIDISKYSEKLRLDFGGIQGTQAMIGAMKELELANKRAVIANEKLTEALKAKSELEKKLSELQKTRSREENTNLSTVSKLEKKLADLRSDESKRVFELKRQIAELTAQRKHEAQMIDSATSSIINMERHVKVLTDAYDRLSDEERQAAKGKELQEKIHKLNTEIRESKVALGNMKANVGNYRQSLDQLEVTLTETRKANNRFRESLLLLKSGNISAIFPTLGNGAKLLGSSIGNMARQTIAGATLMIGKFTALTASLAATFYTIKRWVVLNGTLSDSLAAVRRTTGMTQDDVYNLNETLRKFNTRTAQTSLLDLAHVAGKLGIAKDQIAGFVRAADMIGVALGKDLGDNEEAINQLGRLVSIFKLNTQGTSIEKALLNVGSALKDLGNASVAEEKNILEFTKRIGGIAPIADMSIDKVMGLGATFDILGQSMEVSATAVTRVWIAMAQHPEKFAKIAGKSVDEFVHLMKTDFNQAFIEFVRGLNRGDVNLVKLANDLEGLGIEGYRTIQALSVLSDKTDLYAEQTKIAADSLKEGTTAAEQFEIQNESLGASLDKLTRSLKNLVANSGTIAGLKSGIQWLFDGLSVQVDRISSSGILPVPATDAGHDNIQKPIASSPLLEIQKGNLERYQERWGENGEKAGVANKALIQTRIKILKDEIAFTEKSIELQNQKIKIEKDIADLKQRDADRSKLGELNEDGTQKTKAQLKLEKQLAAAKARELKEQQKHDNNLLKLQDKADSLVEKSWNLRTQYGLTSLHEQEEHEKAALQKEIDDLNERNKQEMILEAEATAKVEGWTQKQLDDRKKQIEQGSQWQIINREQTEEMMYAITMKYVDKCQQAEEEDDKRRKKVLDDYKNKVGDNTTSLKIVMELDYSTKRRDELQALRKLLKKRQITISEYKRREVEINEKYDQEILQKSIELSEKEIEKLKAVGIDTIDLEKKLADLKIALNKKVTDKTIENAERAKEKQNQINQEIFDKSEQLWSAIGNLINTTYDAKIQKIEDDVQANKEAWDAELEHANGNQKLEAEINRKRQRQENELLAEKRKAAKEQAETNKLVSIFTATINTAVGVTGALSQSGTIGPAAAIVMAVLIGLLGAAEIMAIANEPIPQYAKGRKGGKAEWAIVGEKGTEAIEYPSGKTVITPAIPTLTYLPINARVIPHEELMESGMKFGHSSITNRHANNFTVTVTDPYAKDLLNEMRKKKPETQVIVTDKQIIYKTGNYTRITRK